MLIKVRQELAYLPQVVVIFINGLWKHFENQNLKRKYKNFKNRWKGKDIGTLKKEEEKPQTHLGSGI